MPQSAVIAVIYACVITCGGSFTVLSVWGILISLWSVLVFSSAFFRCFFRGTVCLRSFVFPRAFLAFFFPEELEAFCCRLTLLPNLRVLARSSMAFQVFQYASYASYAQQPVSGLASVPSMSALPFSEVLVAVFSSCFGPHNFAFK